MTHALRRLRKSLGLTQSKLAAALSIPGLNADKISKIERHKRELRRNEAARLLELYGEAAHHAAGFARLTAVVDRLPDIVIHATTSESIMSRYVAVNTLEVRLGAGGGGSGEEDFIGEPDLLPVGLIEGELNGQAPDFLLMAIEGTSMVPDLLSGDRVLIDRRKTNPSQPGIFALFDGFGIVAKLVERVPRSDPPQLRMISRDPGLKPYEATLDEARIIGRIVWIARRV